MSLHDCPSRRRVLRLLALGVIVAGLPVGGARPWEPPVAWADDDGDDDDDDDDGDDGDNSGPGGGDDDDGDDRDDDDDRDEDRSGSGGDDDDDDRDDGDGRESSGPGREGPRLRDITVYYPDGWIERIVGGRYELLDHESRLVVRRPATAEDFGRMIALR